MFFNAKTYETGFSDFYKLVLSIMKVRCKKKSPRMIMYRDYKKFSNEHFKNSLNKSLENISE